MTISTKMTTDQKTNPGKPSLSYQDAGVDIDAGNRLVDRIKPIARKTMRKEVLSGLGGFGALFELPIGRYHQPVLVSGTDGVGTKLKLAIELRKYDTIGIDLVAMCVNDLIVQGAEPLFFLDYFSTGHLNIEIASQVIEGIGLGCEMAGTALVGGETAEMPGMYQGEDFDLAGFCVGVVEKDKIIDGGNVSAGNALIAIASSGPHSNGYSLVRKIIEISAADLSQQLDHQTLADWLLAPTRIYVNPILTLLNSVSVHALAHITGGGLLENLPRVIPQHSKAVLESWQRPAIFDWLQSQGNVSEQEMLRTFNCGVGMIICIDRKDIRETLDILAQTGESAWEIGTIEQRMASEAPVQIC